MARFIFLIVAVAVVTLYTNQVASDVVAVDANDDPNVCWEPDASDCEGKDAVKDCKANLCCSGLKYGAADNGTTWAIGSGKCTYCTKGYCWIQFSSAEGSTLNTESDADAVNIHCKLPAV